MSLCDPAWIVDQMRTLPSLYAEELPQLMQSAALPVNTLRNIKTVYAIGNGDSYHAALAAEPFFHKSADVQYIPMAALPFLHYVLPRLSKERARETLVAGISASGSSKLVAQVFDALREGGLAHTLALSGKAEAALPRAAELLLLTAISEKGRSPGIRTYAASLFGLYALALGLGMAQGSADAGALRRLSDAVSGSAAGVEQTISDALRLAPEAAALCEAQFLSVAGSGGGLAAAHFTAAKVVEASGVFAAAQDLEEWHHVESMAYPLSYPVLALAVPDGTLQKAASVLRTAQRVGHRRLLVADSAAGCPEGPAEITFPIHVPCETSLAPLYYYIPGTCLAYALARKHGRAMFLSDQPVKLFE